MKSSEIVKALAALAQESRLAIYRLLVERGPTGVSAGEIGAELKVVPATLSFHLKELNHAGLITSRQEGRYIYYSANFDEMNALKKFDQARKGFLPHLLPDDFESRTTFIEDIKTEVDIPPFGRCTDYLGDGSIGFIPLEGHCRGQIGALLTFTDGRKVLLAADACYLSRSIRNSRGPHWMTRSAADHPGAAVVSLNRLGEFSRLHPDEEVQRWTEVTGARDAWSAVAPTYDSIMRSAQVLDTMIRRKRAMGFEVGQADIDFLHRAYWSACRAAKLKGIVAGLEAGDLGESQS